MKSVFSIIVILLLSKASLAQEIEVNLLVNDSHPPNVYTEQGDTKGIYIEALKRFSERISRYKLTFTAAPRCFPADGLLYVSEGEVGTNRSIVGVY